MEILEQRPDIQKIIEDVAKEQQFENYEIINVSTNQKGEGYLSQIFMVTIKDSSNSLNFVIKSAFKEENIRKLAPIRNSFLNEIFIYTQLEPIFRKLESDNGVTPTQFFPKCYKSLSEENREVLCLENLKAINFELFNKKLMLDDNHVSFIFKMYGRYHAYSYVLKEKQPEIYQEIVGKLHNVYDELITNPDGNFKPYMDSFDELIEKYFKPGKDDEIKKKYNKYLRGGLIDEVSKIVNRKPNFSTILHGDCWSNNMMFKYQMHDNKKKVIDMRFLDLQLAKEGSPVCDLSYCLYSGASKSVFDNLEKYLKIYHNSLSSCLEEFGCNSEKLFPYEILQNHWKKYSRFGMVMALAIIRSKCIDQEDIKDFTDADTMDVTDFTNVKFNENEFQDRVMQLLNHMSEIDAL